MAINFCYFGFWLLTFYARQHICYSAYMLWQFRLSVRLSVCLSVCPSVTRVDQSKTVEARITQFSPYSSRVGSRGPIMEHYRDTVTESKQQHAHQKDAGYRLIATM